MAASYAAQLQIFSKYRREEPLRALLLSAQAVAKREVYRGCYAAGLGERLVAQRWTPASAVEVAAFEVARARVASRVTSLEAQWSTQ